MHPLRRRLGALAALAGSFCLVGCSVDATIVVTTDDMVSVDLTTWQTFGEDLPPNGEAPTEGWSPCGQLEQFAWLALTPLSSDNGLGCHAVGRSALASMELRSLGGIVHAGDRYLAVTGENALGYSPSIASQAGGTPSRIRLTLPGLVEATDRWASVSGSTVTWTAPIRIGETGRLFAVTSVPAPGGPDLLIPLAAAGGLAVGVLSAVAAIRVLRRSDAARPVDDAHDPDEGDA